MSLSNDKKVRGQQIAALFSSPQPDHREESIRQRIALELKTMVNLAALFGVDIPEAAKTEQEQISACKGCIMPKRINSGFNYGEHSDAFDPYKNAPSGPGVGNSIRRGD